MFDKWEKLALGGIPIQRANPQIARELLLALAQDGKHVIDSAKGYSTSEEWLGTALSGLKEQFFLASKSMARDKAGMAKDIDDSLLKFKTDCIDLYQCHNIHKEEDYQRIMADDGAVSALLEAQKAGKIRYLGITSHSIDLIDEKLADCPFSAIQLPYNMLEEKAQATFEKAHLYGIKTLAMKPLCGGVLAEYPCALSFLAQQDCCDIVLIGMADVQEYQANKQAFSQSFKESDKEIAKMLSAELGDSFCRRCGYCLPCPLGINIPIVWLVDAYTKRYGLKQWAQKRHDAEAATSRDCIACGECEKRCPYHLPIIKKMREVAALFTE